jgi:hypothetical protein
MPLPPPATVPDPPVTMPPRNQLSQPEVYKKGTRSVINILCPQGKDTYSVGSGAIVDPRGYILSNAHLADNRRKNEPCIIRRGSPAVEFATAVPLFIPALYYSTSLSERERAEYDISIWKIKDATTTLPYWSLDAEATPKIGEVLWTLSYPAELLSSDIIFKNLWLSFSNTTVTAADSTVMSSKATLSAQHGSSGGILIDPYTGKIRSLIFGIDENQTISERKLFSLLPQAINSAIKAEKGLSLEDYLASSP